MTTAGGQNATTADALLDRLLREGEHETVEFKTAATKYDHDKLGKYVSALSNEARLHDRPAGWFVLGVDDTRTVVGTAAFSKGDQLLQIKHTVSQGIDQGLTVRRIHELHREGKRVLIMEIPPASHGMPVSWHGFYYARNGESLEALSMDKQDRIRESSRLADWTNALVPAASVADLDSDALVRARQGFIERHAPRIPADEVAAWSDQEFLTRAKLMRDGHLTRAAVLLVGGPAASSLLDDHPGQLTWQLRGEQEAYEHFYPPLLLSVSELATRIRNVKLRLMPPNELIYREVSKYEDTSILEALYNAVAHQDYRRHARIVVVERADRLEISSVGEFFAGRPDDYLIDAQPPRSYRNPALVQAMHTLNLVDQMGYGIHRMVSAQMRRFMPLPDYDLSRADEVTLTLHGVVIDERFSQLLMARQDLSFESVLALDRVQKKLDITGEAASQLRRQGLVEGKRPNLRITPSVAAETQDVAVYVRNRPQPDAHYTALLLDYLRANGGADRQEINTFLEPLLLPALGEKRTRNKISNLLAKMRREGLIQNQGSRQRPRWLATASDTHA